MLTSFGSLWTRGIPLAFLSSAGGKKALGRNNAVFITLAMTGGAYVLDSMLSCKSCASVVVANRELTLALLQRVSPNQATPSSSLISSSAVSGWTCSRRRRPKLEDELMLWAPLKPLLSLSSFLFFTGYLYVFRVPSYDRR